MLIVWKKQQEIILYKSKCGVLQQPSIQALGDEIYKYMCVLCISVHLQGKLDRYLEYIWFTCIDSIIIYQGTPVLYLFPVLFHRFKKVICGNIFFKVGKVL